jgi:hypothetical protein
MNSAYYISHFPPVLSVFPTMSDTQGVLPPASSLPSPPFPTPPFLRLFCLFSARPCAPVPCLDPHLHSHALVTRRPFPLLLVPRLYSVSVTRKWSCTTIPSPQAHMLHVCVGPRFCSFPLFFLTLHRLPPSIGNFPDSTKSGPTGFFSPTTDTLPPNPRRLVPRPLAFLPLFFPRRNVHPMLEASSCLTLTHSRSP